VLPKHVHRETARETGDHAKPGTAKPRETGDRPRFSATVRPAVPTMQPTAMPRHARIVAAGFPMHAILRGIDRTAIFFAEPDYRAFLDALAGLAASESVHVHANSTYLCNQKTVVCPLLPSVVCPLLPSTLTRRGLSPRKRRRALLGAITCRLKRRAADDAYELARGRWRALAFKADC